MIELSHVIADPQGLHARPVTDLVAAVLRLPVAAEVTVSCGGHEASARDLVQLMGLGASHGDELRVRVEGPGERDAAERLQRLVQTF